MDFYVRIYSILICFILIIAYNYEINIYYPARVPHGRNTDTIIVIRNYLIY